LVSGICDDGEESSDPEQIVYESYTPWAPSVSTRNALRPLVQEYLNSADPQDFVENFLNYDSSESCRIAAVVVAVEVSLDGNNSDREMVSLLLVSLQDSIPSSLIERSFELLLGSIDELLLDFPDVVHHLGHFLARAVADEILPPRFITNHLELSNPHSREVVHLANGWTSMKHRLCWLDHVDFQNLENIRREFGTSLSEFLISQDVEEVFKTLQSMKVPHFHHEFIFEGILLALNGNSELLERLMKSLVDSGLISMSQLEGGISRINAQLDELSLDIPLAREKFSWILRSLGSSESNAL